MKKILFSIKNFVQKYQHKFSIDFSLKKNLQKVMPEICKKFCMSHGKCRFFLENAFKIFHKLPLCSHVEVPANFHMHFLKFCKKLMQHQKSSKTSMHPRLRYSMGWCMFCVKLVCPVFSTWISFNPLRRNLQNIKRQFKRYRQFLLGNH